MMNLSNITKIPRGNLPAKIMFIEEGDTLHMKMRQDNTSANMQENNAAFEAWAFYAKSEGYERIILSESEPEKEIDLIKEQQHYNRFLYRVLRFTEGFDWFTVSDTLNEKIKNFEQTKLLRTDLCVNAPIVPAKVDTHIPEAHMERLLVCDGNKDFLNRKLGTNIDKFYNQLPVGLFYEKVTSDTAIFPRSHAALDIWGLDNSTFHLVELKAKENQNLGVLSEVFFYACFVYDMYCCRHLERKDSTDSQKYGEKLRGYPELIRANITSVTAHILTAKKHPWLDKAFAELSQCKLNGISFANAVCYSLSEVPMQSI